MDQPTATPPTGGPTAGWPAHLELDAPLEVANWRPLIHWLLAIPHILIYYFLNAANGIVGLISFFAILFTKKIPRGLFDFSTMVMRYQWRMGSYIYFMRESYPPFDFEVTNVDPGNDPASLTVEYPGEWRRFMPLVKWFLAFPHYFVLIFLFIGGFFAWIGAFFAVLFTGKYPAGIRNYMIGVGRWMLRVQVYILMRDEYPPFSLD